MFKFLSEEEMIVVIDAMEERSFAANETVIKEGDDGGVLFVVEEGNLDCYKKFEGQSEPTYLKTYESGQVFGELALLYNAPRAATITAKTAVVLWELDRTTFNNIVKEAAMKKRDKYEEFLLSVPILQSVNSYERAKIADAIKDQTFQPGETVITEGEEGSVFYIIIEGNAIATKTMTNGQVNEVMKYGAGDYFGELALLRDTPRAANVKAKTRLRVASIDRDSFKRLLGPLDEILQRNMEMYLRVHEENE